MADIRREQAGIMWRNYKDMGDGTHAEVVAIGESDLPAGAATEATLAIVQALLAGGLPAALGANGGLKVEGVSGAQPVPVSETSGAGGYTAPTHTAVSVTTSTGQALAANANRRYALLVNDSDAVMYIKLGANAVANQGIRINPGGGSYEMSAKQGNLYTGAINAIHAGIGPKLLLVTEGV